MKDFLYGLDKESEGNYIQQTGFVAKGVTPAMEAKMVGRGSQYAWAARDRLYFD